MVLATLALVGVVLFAFFSLGHNIYQSWALADAAAHEKIGFVVAELYGARTPDARSAGRCRPGRPRHDNLRRS